MIILRIILWILLAAIALVVLVCLANVTVTVGIRESFFWRISVFGIPLPVKLFMRNKDANRKKQHREGKVSGRKKKKKVRQSAAEEKQQEKPRKSLGDTLSNIFELAQTALRELPKVFRIKLHCLDVTVGGKEAADIAITYGKLYALTEGSLAALDNYKGILYGFRANRKKISLKTDFLSPSTKVKFKLTISFFVWQLLRAAVRVGVRWVLMKVRENE